MSLCVQQLELLSGELFAVPSCGAARMAEARRRDGKRDQVYLLDFRAAAV
jgi:hypothetical protein